MKKKIQKRQRHDYDKIKLRDQTEYNIKTRQKHYCKEIQHQDKTEA